MPGEHPPEHPDSLVARVHRIVRESEPDPTPFGGDRTEDIVVGTGVLLVVAILFGGFAYTMLSTLGFAPTLIMVLVGIVCYAIGAQSQKYK